MKRLIVDFSNLLWTSLLVGKDGENGRKIQHNGKEIYINSAQWGVDCAINNLVTCLEALSLVPSDIIFVVETGNSKARRQAMYKPYKQDREERHPLLEENFQKAKDEILTLFGNLGATWVTQPHTEGDDVIAYLAEHLGGEKIIYSTDGDLAQLLVLPDVMLWKSGTLVASNPYGDFDPTYIRVMKALVGDGNEYPGCPKFGPKKWEALLERYGSALPVLDGWMETRNLDELQDDVADFPPFQLVLNNLDLVYTSYQLAKLRPDWVNLLRVPLQWHPGMVKPATDYRLKKWGQQVRLITAETYDQALAFFEKQVRGTPFFSLDIETSTPDESDEWLAARDAEKKVDVLGSELTGMGLTFGPNSQYTYYLSVDHRDTPNCTSEQVRQLVASIPSNKFVVVHNAAFELPILAMEWADQQRDNGWHGFIPNVIDNAICSSYVDENQSQGLKANSKLYLGYEQESYEHVTTARMMAHEWDHRGKIIRSYRAGLSGEEAADLELHDWIEVQYKMNELSAAHVLSYGADDTICTAALYRFFRTIMEMEHTWDVFLEVEQLPAYVGALAYVQGTKFSLERMLELEREDHETYAKAWAVVREALIEHGWEGTVCPVFSELTPAGIKEITKITLGLELKTQMRTVSKIAKLVAEMDHPDAKMLAGLIEACDVYSINKLVAARFEGEPIFDVGSPKQMKEFLYGMLDLPVRIVNNCTPKERTENRDLYAAVSRHKKIWAGSETEPPITDEEMQLLKLKAKTDDTAVDFALAMDRPGCPILHAFQKMKKCSTRQSLFYNTYKTIRHWKDNKVHGQAGQSRTVTRRFAPSDPNLAQLPKKNEGAKFRECFLPHHKDAVMCSIDFAGQELRQGAGQSMDANMLACFVGDNLKDMHSLTAAGAMEKKWGMTVLSEMIQRFGKDGDSEYDLFLRLRKCKEDEAVAKMADDLRKVAKNVNFGAQYDAMAPKLAETLIIPVADAQAFLEAKFAMFPRFEEWKEEVKAEAGRLGYVTTCMGARRHLREAILSDNKWDMEKAMRQGPNFKIQGSSAEQTKLAMARVWRSGVLWKYDVVFFAPIHDELVFSVHRDHALEVIKIFHDAMVEPYGNLPVPFLGSISLGPNFGKQHEAGDWYIEENIKEILAKIFSGEVAEVV